MVLANGDAHYQTRSATVSILSLCGKFGQRRMGFFSPDLCRPFQGHRLKG
ncbi:hypothetical protein YpUG050454_4496 [Yersinia pestis biovar Antiqua str. UG05-0454]|nr:hypothetical protein YpUG050454_4496 [Yersinia pestis biovar Antiqua str. UG05-0454]